MNQNPRKFEEKIALHNQKQKEQDKQFEDIIRDVSTIRDNECNQFRSLPNIHGPPPGMYQYNVPFNVPVTHMENFRTDIHQGLNLQLPETQSRRVLSDSQLHKSGERESDEDNWNNHSLPRPKSALSVKSYEGNISTKTISLPDLSQNYIPVQDESYSQNILHQHYQDGVPDNLRLGGHHPGAAHQFPLSQHPGGSGGGYFMSIDEATASELKHRVRQYSPSPPATPQMNYTFGSPNANYQRMTAQMQEFNLHSPTNQMGIHSGNCSPHSHTDQPSPDVYDIKPGIEEAIAQSQPQYMGYYQSQPTTPQDASSYSNPPSIPKIQVYTPEEALSPQYFPPDEDMEGAGTSDMSEYLLNFDADQQQPLLHGGGVEDVVQGGGGGSMDLYQGGANFHNYPYS